MASLPIRCALNRAFKLINLNSAIFNQPKSETNQVRIREVQTLTRRSLVRSRIENKVWDRIREPASNLASVSLSPGDADGV